MQLLKRWGYLLFMTALSFVWLIGFHDLRPSVVMLAIWVGGPLYQKFSSVQRRKWLIPCGMMFALALGVLYYAADLSIFPHSPRAAHRLYDACVLGSLWGFAGIGMWSPLGKFKTTP